MVMVTATGGNALRMDFDLARLASADAELVARNSTVLVIRVDGLRYSFTGADILYDGAFAPVSGRFTGLDITRDGSLLFRAEGFSVDAAALHAVIEGPGDPFALIFAGDDSFRGSPLGDSIEDYWGHNILIGRDGADVLRTGGGNDHLYGGAPDGGLDGADSLYGGDGSDYLQGNAGDDVVHGEAGSDRINGGADDDRLDGDDGNDTINGNRGEDDVRGGAGNDLLRGGQDDDLLDGGDGNDILSGDRGFDRLTGGAGADIFVFGPGTSPVGGGLIDPTDRIEDFERGEDHISLGFVPEALLRGTADPYAGAAIDYVGSARNHAQHLFDEHPGDHEVAIVQVIGWTYLFWDADGNGSVDSGFELRNSSGPGDYALEDFV